jgi:hypothetical protein
MLLAVPTAAIAAAFLVTPSLAATPASTTAPSPTVAPAPAPATAQGIIMRDGGICDPIRHMGC